MMTQTKPANQNQNQPQTRGNATAQPTQPAQSTAPEAKPAPVIDMHEAPYSWNVSAQDANGFIEMFTVRAVSETGFMERVARVKAQLMERGYKPAPTRGASSSASANAPANANETHADAAPLCGIHGTPMEWRETRRGSFWSCPKKFANGDYCNYKAPKQ